MIVREANLDDARAIARVHVDTWLTSYRSIISEVHLTKFSYERREQSWNQILSSTADTGEFVFVVENASRQIIGFASGGKERTGDRVYKGELYAIYVLNAYQRQGIGYSLTLAVVNRLSQLGFNSMLVWVLADNPACGFYQAIGGQKVCEKQIERGGVALNEIAYGWQDTTIVRDRTNLLL